MIRDGYAYKTITDANSRSPATSDLPIRPLAKGGRVVLNGVVQSRQQRRVAAETVGGVRGVAAIDNWMRVDDTAPRPDEAIEKDVESALQSDIRVDDTLLDVSVDGGRVTLEGSVGSGAERTRARTDALSQSGVVAVDDTGVEVAWVTENDLIRHAETQPTDGEIRAAVVDALASDPRVDSRRTEVTVEDGEATLTGVVDDLWTRRVAARDATDTVGVIHVHDFLKVRPATRLTDEDLSSRVQRALKSDADLSRYDIRANVLEGTAVLEGRVPTAFDSDLAERVMARIDGVTAVDDVLLVTGVEQQKPDLVVEDDIRSQLWWSPYVDADAVNVSVRDGVATLTGMVATRRERMAAASNAREGGARRVRNEIRLRAGR
jgi:osmotically-inducible protein OsmY